MDNVRPERKPLSPERVATAELRPIYDGIVHEKSESLREENWSKFTEREQTVIAISWLNTLTSNGGFSHYLWCVSDEMGRIAARALVQIGAVECAQVFEEANQVFRKTTESRPSNLRDLDHDRLRLLSDRFFVLTEGEDGCGGEEGIMQLLLKYWRETDDSNAGE